jgi:transcription termination factor Rho
LIHTRSRTGSSDHSYTFAIEGHIRNPKEGERYFALLKVNTLNVSDCFEPASASQ